MVDILEQIKYWQNGAAEDWLVPDQLITGDKVRHGLFFAHLSLGKIAPKIHNLVKLAETAGLNLSDDKIDFLAEMSEFNLEGRYTVPFLPQISSQEAKEYIKKTKEVLEWFSRQL